MGCCGKKRAEWLEEINNVNSQKPAMDVDTEKQKEYKPKIFEFIGDRSLKIRGTTSGVIYYFRFCGHKLSVSHEDSFSMMGERDLRIATETQKN